MVCCEICVAAMMLVLFSNFLVSEARDLSHQSNRKGLRRLQNGTTYSCIVDGVDYCQQYQIDVPAGWTTPSPATSPSANAPVQRYPSPVSSPTTPRPTPLPTPRPTPSPVSTTSSPITTDSPTIGGTREPSDQPSLSPSSLPSPSPTTTPYPTVTFSPSSLPSYTPTRPPTSQPTSSPSLPPSPAPTEEPTKSPSQAPSASSSPTMDPDTFDTTIKVGRDGFPKAISTCRRDVPPLSKNITNQLIRFDYILNIVPGSSAALSMSTVTMRLHNALTEKYLKCAFTGDSDSFDVSRMSTNPGDALSNQTCASNQRFEENECYIVNGAFSVQTFYYNVQDNPNQKRNLVVTDDNSYVIRDKDVLDSFSSSLQDIFQSGVFETSTIASTTFSGVTNSEVTTSKSEAAVVAGSVVGTLVALGLICGVILFAAKGYSRRKAYSEEIKDQHSLSLYEDRSQTASGDISPGEEHEEDPAVLGPIVFSDTDTLNENERFEVVAHDPNRYARPPQPASEDDALDELVTRSMLSRVKRDLGPRTAPASPRRYDIEDTVDL